MTGHDDPAVQVPGKELSGAAKQSGGFAPGLVGFTDDVLFGQVWTRPELSPRDRGLVTVTALTTAGNTGQLTYHLSLAKGPAEWFTGDVYTWLEHVTDEQSTPPPRRRCNAN